MSGAVAAEHLGFEVLKGKQRELRVDFPTDFGLRIHRAISWLGRSEQEMEDLDVRFILLWIGFNAVYARDVHEDVTNERDAFRRYFDAVVKLDGGQRIYGLVWRRFPHEIRLLLQNPFVFGPFWSHANGTAGYSDWEVRMAQSQKSIGRALARQDTGLILAILFDRLYILRNQLVHGGATWNGSVNRNQVRDGAAILTSLLPIFIDVMMDNPHLEWGRPYYPVLDHM